MTSPTLFGTYALAIVAGLIASAVFVAAQPVFHGVGGKLGTTAFVGATVTIVLTAGQFESQAIPDDITIGLIVGYAVLGAILTFAFHHRTRAGAVLASGVVGALGAWGLPILHASGGELLAAAVFSASFAGMTTATRIPDERWMALTGLLVGFAFVYTMPYLGGSGGKLGTIAFGACLAINGPLRGLHIVRLQRAFEGAPRRDTT